MAEQELAGICAELGSLLGFQSGQDLNHLLDIEQTASKLRQSSERFFDTQRKGLEEISDRFEEQRKNPGPQKPILRGRSLSVEIRKRVYRENKAVQNVLDKLENLHSIDPEIQTAIAELCLDLAVLLERSSIAKNALLHNMTEVLKSGKGPQKNPKTALMDSDLSETKMEAPTESQDLPASESLGKNVQTDDVDASLTFPFLPHKRSGIRKVLVVAKEGAGKTHLCNEIERSLGEKARVHRLDVYGRTIGELEDNVISLFNGVFTESRRHILLVDDFDELVGSVNKAKTSANDPDESRESHASSRASNAFLGAMDSFFDSSSWNPHLNVALVCTAKSNANLSLARFDTVHTLEIPTCKDRRIALAGFMGHLSSDRVPPVQNQTQIEAALDDLAELSVGLSYAEIAQKFRQAIIAKDKVETIPRDTDCKTHEDGNVLELLDRLKESLQSFAPESLRSGVMDGYVDLRVSSSEDLLDLSPCPPNCCPLFGHNSDLAWKELESNIVIPLCRSKELNLLLLDQEKPAVQGGLSCGVVLTGPAGSGKSTLAQHCAAFAASVNPSLKFLEVSCTSMIHKEVGASEKAIHHLFECARNTAPCVVVLDDVAIISSVRGKDNTTEGTMDRVLSTLLTELDGVERDAPVSGDGGGIAVIGITQNVKWVDPALLRPGRLGKIVRLDTPDRETRIKISLRQLEIHFRKDSDAKFVGETSDESRELSELIADQTEGMAGSSVIALCNDAKQSCLAAFAASASTHLPGENDILASMHNFLAKNFS